MLCGNQYKYSHSPKKKKYKYKFSRAKSVLNFVFYHQKDPTLKQDYIIDYSHFTAVNYDPA